MFTLICVTTLQKFFFLFLEELGEISLQMYLPLHVKCLTRLLDFIKTWILLVSLTVSRGGSQIVYAEEQRKDRQRDVRKLVVALGNFSNIPLAKHSGQGLQ